MEIVPYLPAHLPGVYEVYRQIAEKVPHCRFIPSAAYVGQALLRAQQQGVTLLVAEEEPSVSGIASLSTVAPARDGVLEREISGLFAQTDPVVDALLAACLSRAENARRLVAFPADHGHCPLPSYNAGWDGLSDQMPAVARALARRGFAPTYRELQLECAGAHFPPTPVAAPPGITLVESKEDGITAVRAMDGAQEAGVCVHVLLSHHSDHAGAGGWGYIDWLHVAEGQRRRGIGRYLMTWTLQRLHEQGCRGCWLTTGASNWPAQPLYLSLGFEILDTSSSWVKAL